MAAKVKWLDEALADLDRALGYIEQQSPNYAQIVGEAILAAVKDLELFPMMGGLVPERKQKDLRQRIVYSYRVIYRVAGERVELLGIIHCSRLFSDEIANRGT